MMAHQKERQHAATGKDRAREPSLVERDEINIKRKAAHR
jgi:hypothetical protein